MHNTRHFCLFDLFTVKERTVQNSLEFVEFLLELLLETISESMRYTDMLPTFFGI